MREGKSSQREVEGIIGKGTPVFREGAGLS